MIRQCNEILQEYQDDGYTLTLRQLYYQLVAADSIPNSQKSYKRLGDVVSRARDGGLIDWNHIVDRTRTVMSRPVWDDKTDFMESVIPQYHHDFWKDQPTRVMVFVEKEALAEVVSRPARRWDVPYFANKGYLSASSVWNVARNMMLHNDDRCKHFIVLHLGDHDPSGIDMTRDIQERLNLYAGTKSAPVIEVRRIALNMDQIDLYDPPPNPAKATDSRFESYRKQFGDESWELDALTPRVIDSLINDAIEDIVMFDMWQDRKDEKEAIVEELKKQSGIK